MTMKLEDIRKDIDVLDAEIRELLMKRLDYAEQVVQTKIDDGIHHIYLEEREDNIMANMSDGVPEERLPEMKGFARKMIESSRMLQYSILYDQVDGLFEELLEDVEIPAEPKKVRFEMIRDNVPGQAAAIFGLISDYGYNVTEIQRMDNSIDNSAMRLWITIGGSIEDINVRKMLLQLSQESQEFEILSVE
ncbi:MAG: chorismate mutase [Firmicutes bacterium]|nr:chorismate mutase [Bacillota bacterium]